MAEQNVEIVRRIFDGWAKGDFNVGVDALDPNVTVVVRPPFIEFGIFHGPEGITKYFMELSFFMLFTFRGGKIIRIETVMAEAEALEAVGLPE